MNDADKIARAIKDGLFWLGVFLYLGLCLNGCLSK